ncbi:WhiB family transcriptional regulator [Mycobacterium sherrisii]|uniref:WhiB family transcriptional regulator n=1 Tax=Mycobacterium sherrisii TaxID=243061 RepID=UPI003975D558
MVTTGTVDLLAAVLRGSPRLPRALCATHDPRLFDADDPADAAAAIAICRRCPEREPCASWCRALPARQRPHGVVGGRVYPQKRGRPRENRDGQAGR